MEKGETDLGNYELIRALCAALVLALLMTGLQTWRLDRVKGELSIPWLRPSRSLTAGVSGWWP